MLDSSFHQNRPIFPPPSFSSISLCPPTSSTSSLHPHVTLTELTLHVLRAFVRTTYVSPSQLFAPTWPQAVIPQRPQHSSSDRARLRAAITHFIALAPTPSRPPTSLFSACLLPHCGHTTSFVADRRVFRAAIRARLALSPNQRPMD